MVDCRRKYRGICSCKPRTESKVLRPNVTLRAKSKEKASLSRGGNYQIKRHSACNHPTLTLDSLKKQIVPVDHILVPREFRTQDDASTSSIRSTEEQFVDPGLRPVSSTQTNLFFEGECCIFSE